MTPGELAQFEIVVAAPHSALRSPNDQTARMMAAVQTPGVHILGHPRGRMYGSRPGVTADWEHVFIAAARFGVAIELDGDPARQDLDYDLAQRAVASGCLFAIDSDAHGTDQWWYAETALAHARLAGVPRSRVINCWPLAKLLDWAQSRSKAAYPLTLGSLRARQIGCTCLRFVQPTLEQGVAHDVDAAAHVEFPHAVRLVRLDGLHAQIQSRRNFLVGIAPRD